MLEVDLFGSYDRQKRDERLRLKLQTKETARKRRWNSMKDFAISFYHNPRDTISPLLVAGLLGLNVYTFVRYQDLKDRKEVQPAAVNAQSPVAPSASNSVSGTQSDNSASPLVQMVLASENQLREERERVFLATADGLRVYCELEELLDVKVSNNRKLLDGTSADNQALAVELNDSREYFQLRSDVLCAIREAMTQNFQNPQVLHDRLCELKQEFSARIELYGGLGDLRKIEVVREVLPSDYNDRVIALREDHARTLRLRELYKRQMGALLDAQVSLEARLESRVIDNQRRASELSASERLSAYAQNDSAEYLRLRADIARVFSAVSSEFGGTDEFNSMLDERIAPLIERVGRYDGLGNVRIQSSAPAQTPAVERPPAVEPQTQAQPQRQYSPRIQRELDDLRRRLEYTESQHNAGRLNDRAYERMKDSIQERIRVLENQ